MKIFKTLQYGIIGSISLLSISACKNKPYIPAENVPKAVTERVDSFQRTTQPIINDSSYIKYGEDTIHISKSFYTNPDKFLKSLNKKAERKTPKIIVGTHMETLMIPKSGGGFNYIPTVKNDYEPDYKNQKAVINSNKIFTTNGKDLYIPIEYYGEKTNN